MATITKCILCGAEEGNEIGKVSFILKRDICTICCDDLYADYDEPETDEE